MKEKEELKNSQIVISDADRYTNPKFRMLTQIEIERLQKDKRESFEKMTAILDALELDTLR